MWLKLLKKRKEGSKKATAQALANQISLYFPARARSGVCGGGTGYPYPTVCKSHLSAIRLTRPTIRTASQKLARPVIRRAFLFLTQSLHRCYKCIHLMRGGADKPFVLRKNLL